MNALRAKFPEKFRRHKKIVPDPKPTATEPVKPQTTTPAPASPAAAPKIETVNEPQKSLETAPAAPDTEIFNTVERPAAPESKSIPNEPAPAGDKEAESTPAPESAGAGAGTGTGTEPKAPPPPPENGPGPATDGTKPMTRDENRTFAAWIHGIWIAIMVKFFGEDWQPKKITETMTELDLLNDSLADWLVEIGAKPLRAVHRYWLAVAGYCAPRLGSIIGKFGKKKTYPPQPPASPGTSAQKETPSPQPPAQDRTTQRQTAPPDVVDS